MRSKTELLNEIAQRLRSELARVRDKLRKDEITKEDEELIERLRKIGSVVDDMPVWPFDARTAKKFATAYVIPLIGSAGIPLAKVVIRLFSTWFPT